MTPKVPRRCVGAGLLTALGLCGMCCSLLASCRPRYITLDFSTKGEGGSASASSGGSGGGEAGGGGAGTGGGGTGGMKRKCDDDEVCLVPEEGDGPYLLWIGSKGHAPAKVPTRALQHKFSHGYADLVKPPSACQACTCGTLNHTCELPTKMTAYDVPCPGGPQGQPFDAAPAWAGTCDDSNPIPGPNTVQSILIGPMSLVESCPPNPATQTPENADWTTEAAAFANSLPPGCDGSDSKVCAPAVTWPGDPPEGFRLCMYHNNGDVPCNGTSFIEKHVFYQTFVDTRTCDPCTCTPPAMQGTCQSFVTIYQDINNSCNGSEVGMYSISSDKSTCVDINPAGQQLGSKSATAPHYIPAPGNSICQPSGGTLHGDVEGGNPVTFCCQPSNP